MCGTITNDPTTIRTQFFNGLLQKFEGKPIYGCEVGVGGGLFAKMLLESNPNLFMLEIAYFPHLEKGAKTTQKRIQSNKQSKEQFIGVMNQFKQRMSVIWKQSHKAVSDVPDGLLDFVFIDANHSYPHVRQDIKLWYPKVRKGGLVSGHDYNTDRPKRFSGVIKAVKQYFGDDFKVGADYVWYYWK